MCGDLIDIIETLRDCANALDELLPRDHAYRKIVEQAIGLLDRHDPSGRAGPRLGESGAGVAK